VARADYLGRTTEEALATQDSRQIPDILWLLERAQGLRVESQGPKPLLMGRHLMGLGVLPGPQMGVVLKAAFEAQLDDAFTDEPGAVLWAEAYLSPGIEA
jgi:tRNA nucleotidyltransferase (CCA-adding enzyme)